MNSEEYSENEKLECPHCGFEFVDWWEEWPQPHEVGDETEIHCESCDHKFIATYGYSVFFDAKLKI